MVYRLPLKILDAHIEEHCDWKVMFAYVQYGSDFAEVNIHWGPEKVPNGNLWNLENLDRLLPHSDFVFRNFMSTWASCSCPSLSRTATNLLWICSWDSVCNKHRLDERQ